MPYEDYFCVPSHSAIEYLFYVMSAGYYKCAEDYNKERLKFSGYHYIYTLSGVGYLEYNGKLFTSTKNTALLFDSTQPHHYYTDKRKLWEHYYIFFDGKAMPFWYSQIHEKYGNYIQVNDNSVQRNSLKEIIDLMKSNSSGAEVRISTIINNILGDILCKDSPAVGPATGSMPFVEQAKRIMDMHFHDEGLSIEKVSESLKVNRSYLAREFKKALGISPVQYLINKKIEAAKQLALKDNVKFKDIAALCGFSSETRMAKHFKEKEGISPRGFRRRA